MRTFKAALMAATLALVAGPLPIEAKQIKQKPAETLCDRYASLSERDLLRALDQAVASGASGWPGGDTVCMGASQVEAELPAPRKHRHEETAN